MTSSPSPRFHWLRLRATAHPTEDPARVTRAVLFAAGVDDAERVETTTMETHHGADMVLVELELKRAAEIRACLAHLDAALPSADETEARMDDDGVYYFRIDKQGAFQETIRAARNDDAIQVRMKPEVHPARREAAVAAVATWLLK